MLRIIIIDILIIIYLGINFITLGVSLGMEPRGRKLSIFNVIIFALFGVIIIAAVFIFDNYIVPVVNIFKLKFIWQFYFTDKWKKTRLIVLKNLNRFLYSPTIQKKNLKNWIYKRSLNMVFKRNNYKPQEYKTGLEWLGTIPKTSKVTILSPDGWFNEKDFSTTLITKKQFIENMQASVVKHAITFEMDKF